MPCHTCSHCPLPPLPPPTPRQEHGLLSFLGGKAALLLAIDESRALDLLVSHLDSVAPADVVPGWVRATLAKT